MLEPKNLTEVTRLDFLALFGNGGLLRLFLQGCLNVDEDYLDTWAGNLG